MGGRLDSTNVFENPILSVITGVALDHTAFLGDTTEKVAAEKAGILKKGCPALVGNADKGALAVIENKATSLSCPIYKVDYNKIQNLSLTLDGSSFDFGSYQNVHIPLLGMYQPRNAANVLTAVDILKNEGFQITEESLQKGLSHTTWKARFEKLSAAPIVLYDSSHNPEGIEYAVKTIK
jgi:dihydrofolate synthase/folylpolyglutamate synthase